jgi:DNA-binding PadR family transcriptional regulator
VYATLGRLEDRELVAHRMSDPVPVRGGRSRKVYDLTPAGRTALERATAMIVRMMDGLALGGGAES